MCHLAILSSSSCSFLRMAMTLSLCLKVSESSCDAFTIDWSVPELPNDSVFGSLYSSFFYSCDLTTSLLSFELTLEYRPLFLIWLP